MPVPAITSLDRASDSQRQCHPEAVKKVDIDALKSFVLYLCSFNFMAGNEQRFVTEFARVPELSGFFPPQSNRNAIEPLQNEAL